MADYENGKVDKDADKSPEEHTYTSTDLDEMGEVLLKAKEIQADTGLHTMVMDHLNGKVKKIKSLDDLRKRQREVETRDNDMADAYNGE